VKKELKNEIRPTYRYQSGGLPLAAFD
jgi:hypothetical protein